MHILLLEIMIYNIECCVTRLALKHLWVCLGFQVSGSCNYEKRRGESSLPFKLCSRSTSLPLVVSSRQRRAGRRLPADLVLLLHHAVAERDEVALQDDQALPETLGRQGAFGHLGWELLLVINQDSQTVLQLSLVWTEEDMTTLNLLELSVTYNHLIQAENCVLILNNWLKVNKSGSKIRNVLWTPD